MTAAASCTGSHVPERVLTNDELSTIVDEVEASRDPESEDARFMARIDAPSPHAALGALLTVIAQTSGHAGLADQGALHRVVIEREKPAR